MSDLSDSQQQLSDIQDIKSVQNLRDTMLLKLCIKFEYAYSWVVAGILVVVDTVLRAMQLGQLACYLKAQGLEVSEVTDIAEIEALVQSLGKPYLTPMSSPAMNDFTQPGIIALVARAEGVPVMIGCARIEDLGEEAVDRYWSRVFRRAYGDDMAGPLLDQFNPEVVSRLRGRLVYFGDLFVADGYRGSRLALRAFVAVGHLAVSLKWNPDWTYCFVRERDVLRGAAYLYGFDTVSANPFQWLRDPPSPRDRSEMLASVSRASLRGMISSTVSAVAER